MFNNQKYHQMEMKGFKSMFQSSFVFLLIMLLVSACSDNPVAPDNNNIPTPNPGGQELSISIDVDSPTITPGGMVQFSSIINGGKAPYNCSWIFGDGSSSSVQNPSHIYASAGSFSVRLVVSDSLNQADTAFTNISVIGSSGLSCTLIASDTIGQAPLSISFKSYVSGGTAPYTYKWDFGDGTSSTIQFPSHSFNSAGTYTVSLKVADADMNSITESVRISVSSPTSDLDCALTANVTSGRAPIMVSFTGNASNGSAPYTYNWDFGDGNSSIQQNPSHTYQNPGTYTAVLTVTDASSASCSKSISISALSSPRGPMLTGPGTVTTDFLLSWTFNWPTLVATGEGVVIEESTTSPSGGFSEIASVTRNQGSQIIITDRNPGTYYYRVRAYVNQGINPGWTDYSNVVTVLVEAPASKTRFTNNTSYILISLKIDGVEYLTNSSMGIMPGNWIEFNLSPGSHSYSAVNGFWDGSSPFDMYSWSGSLYQNLGEDNTVTFNDPTINQLLTRFQSSGYWEGDFWNNLMPHKAGFRFYTDGTWRLYVDGSSFSTGTYRLVSRNSSSFSVVFSVGDYEATLYEIQGRFVMRNGPPDWPLIEYFYKGQ